MSRFLPVLILLCIGQTVSAQYVYTIKADSVKITNSCDTAELILENHTQTVPGFLFNKGRGRTEFRRGAVALNDSLYLIGGDTLNLYKGRVNVTASNGLTAADGNIKMGGDLIDLNTILRLTTDDTTFERQFIIQSADGLSTFGIQGYNYGDFNMVGNSYNNRNGANASFGLQSWKFGASASKGTSSASIWVDTMGFHCTKNFAAGFQNAVPTAKVHMAAGTAAANTAPLKFTSGTLLATPEIGAVEFDGTYLYMTEHSKRYILAKTLQGQLTTNFGGPSLTAFNSITTTLTVAGAQPGDVVNVSANTGAVNPPSIIITAYVTSTDTVTLQAYNASSSAVTIASDTYNVRVIK